MPTPDMTYDTAVATNLVLVAALALLYRPIATRVPADSPHIRAVSLGTLFGVVAIACMMVGLRLGPGIVLDQRGMALALSGLLAGPLAAMVTAAMAGAWRLWMGGAGTVAGMFAIGSAAAVGIILHVTLDHRRIALRRIHLLGLGFAVALSTISSFMLLPAEWQSWHWIVNSGGPIAAMNGASIILVGSFLIGEQRRLGLEQQIRTLNTNLPGVLYQRTLTPDGRSQITYISPNVRRLFGIDPEAVVAQPDRLLRHVKLEDRERLLEAYRDSAVTMAPVDLDVRARYPGQPIRWIRVSAHPVADGRGAISWHGLLRDVTERHAQTEMLHTARSEAERASRTKSEFLASMSHELRTPLNAIIGFSQLLLSDRMVPMSSVHQDYVRHVLSAGNHLLGLINDILDLSRVEAGRLTVAPEPLDAADIVADIRGSLGPMVDQAGLRLETPDCAALPPICADRTRLTQVLINLVSNAIKYNRPGGTITVEVGPAENPAFARIAVVDTGRGIPAERQAQLFEPFNRLGAEGSAIEGTGIGLTIAKRLMELMGGGIGVTSTPGIGSRFWIDVPWAPDVPMRQPLAA